jgi:hypothetical protein
MTPPVLLIFGRDRRDELHRMLLAETGLDEADGKADPGVSHTLEWHCLRWVLLQRDGQAV